MIFCACPLLLEFVLLRSVHWSGLKVRLCENFQLCNSYLQHVCVCKLTALNNVFLILPLLLENLAEVAMRHTLLLGFIELFSGLVTQDHLFNVLCAGCMLF